MVGFFDTNINFSSKNNMPYEYINGGKTMKKKYIIIVAVTLFMVIAGLIISLNASESNEVIKPSFPQTSIPKEEIKIEIKGAVKRPGIYAVDETYCINDIIILAGGLLKNADVSSLNLASKVKDGQLIIVKEKVEIDENQSTNGLISINKATIEELTSLSGIGSVTATNIINYRNEHGFFTSIEELLNVPKFSENLLFKIKDYICV